MRCTKGTLLKGLIALCTVWLLTSNSNSLASSDHADLYAANAAYRAGEYRKASTLYKQALNSGTSNPALLYNLANAQFKSNKPGQAIVNYRRALRLDPSNPDIRANLQKVRSSLGRPSTPEPSSLFQVPHFIREQVGTRSLQFLFLGTYAGFWVIWLFAHRGGSIRLVQYALAFLALCFAVPLFFLTEQADGSYTFSIPVVSASTSPAVLVADETAHSGDGEHFAAIFKLREGDEVLFLGRRNSWVKVQTDSGRIGWLPEHALEII